MMLVLVIILVVLYTEELLKSMFLKKYYTVIIIINWITFLWPTFNNLPSLVPTNISTAPSTCTITDDVNCVSASLTTGEDVRLPPLSASTSSGKGR